MSRTYTQLLTHVVFSTKERVRLIAPEIKAELHAYLGGLIRELKGKPYSVNGTEDHVHLLISLPPVVSISDALRFIKAILQDGFTTNGLIAGLLAGNSDMAHSALANQSFTKLSNIFTTRKGNIRK